MKRLLQIATLLFSAVLCLLAGAALYDLTAPAQPRPEGGPTVQPTHQVSPQPSAPQIYVA
jgi:hypothetical protein